MARRIEYTGEPVLTPAQIAEWRRNDAVLLEAAMLADIIIPGVVAQCESRTGAAIREARYVETWPASRKSGHALDVGQAHTVESVDVLGADGATVAGLGHYLRQEQRESMLYFSAGRPPGTLRITYLAGLDLDAYPAVRNWLLLNIGTVYSQRESMVIGASVVELPSGFLDHMLAEITVPPRF